MKKLLILGVLGVAVYLVAFRPRCGRAGALECPVAELEEGVGVTLTRREVCPRSGYLCLGSRNLSVARWPLTTGALRVRVTAPPFADPATGEAIRALVIEGIQAWDGYPFPVIVDARPIPLRIPDIDVVWTEGLYNARQLGLSTNSWQQDGKGLKFRSHGLAVVVPPEASQGGPDLSAALRAQLKATAMHEMGHALGLLHSDQRADIMFPELRLEVLSPRLSARDVRTVEALYSLPNGAVIQ